jgi:hypothetical protein
MFHRKESQFHMSGCFPERFEKRAGSFTEARRSYPSRIASRMATPGTRESSSQSLVRRTPDEFVIGLDLFGDFPGEAGQKEMTDFPVVKALVFGVSELRGDADVAKESPVHIRFLR